MDIIGKLLTKNILQVEYTIRSNGYHREIVNQEHSSSRVYNLGHIDIIGKLLTQNIPQVEYTIRSKNFPLEH